MNKFKMAIIIIPNLGGVLEYLKIYPLFNLYLVYYNKCKQIFFFFYIINYHHPPQIPTKIFVNFDSVSTPLGE